MELPRLTLLNQVRLRLSAEGSRAIYLAQDLACGRIFTLPREQALALRRMQATTAGDTGSRIEMSDADARSAYGFLHLLEKTREIDLGRKPFNPVFANLPLFDPGPVQPAFRGFAKRIVAPGFFAAMLGLAILCFILGARNDWEMLAAFGQMFSAEALVTFGFIAPVLKVVHEFGHFLVATRFGVRVRRAGLYLIALYPMPYVDCTEADMTARRRDRILISLAGLITDFSVGMLAFVAWHFVGGTYLQTLLGNVVVFSTLNSLLFNANPLMKLDGYYVLADAIGARNLSTRAHAAFRDARLCALTFGAGGAWPRGWRQHGLVLYAVAALFYRTYVLFVIAMTLLPRYLGLGAMLAAWGGFVMFFSPLLSETHHSPAARITGPIRQKLWLGRIGLLGSLALVIGLVPMPFRATVPIGLDLEGRYTVTSETAGFVTEDLANGMVRAGATVLELGNPILREELALLNERHRGANLAYAAVQGANQAKATAARNQIRALAEQRDVMQSEVAGLEVDSPSRGLFVPGPDVEPGQYIESGTMIGWHLPVDVSSQWSGDFPENYFEKFDSLRSAEMRIDGEYHDLDNDAVSLHPVVRSDAGSGARFFMVKASHEAPPAAVAGKPGYLRLVFASEPLYEHIRFWFSGVIARFREAQLIDLDVRFESAT